MNLVNLILAAGPNHLTAKSRRKAGFVIHASSLPSEVSNHKFSIPYLSDNLIGNLVIVFLLVYSNGLTTRLCNRGLDSFLVCSVRFGRKQHRHETLAGNPPRLRKAMDALPPGYRKSQTDRGRSASCQESLFYQYIDVPSEFIRVVAID